MASPLMDSNIQSRLADMTAKQLRDLAHDCERVAIARRAESYRYDLFAVQLLGLAGAFDVIEADREVQPEPPALRPSRWDVLRAFEALGSGDRLRAIRLMGWQDEFGVAPVPHVLLKAVAKRAVDEGKEAEFIAKCREAQS